MKYNQQFDAYEMKRRDPAFKNGSNQMAGAFLSASSSNIKQYSSPSK